MQTKWHSCLFCSPGITENLREKTPPKRALFTSAQTTFFVTLERSECPRNPRGKNRPLVPALQTDRNSNNEEIPERAFCLPLCRGHLEPELGVWKKLIVHRFGGLRGPTSWERVTIFRVTERPKLFGYGSPKSYRELRAPFFRHPWPASGEVLWEPGVGVLEKEVFQGFLEEEVATHFSREAQGVRCQRDLMGYWNGGRICAIAQRNGCSVFFLNTPNVWVSD